MLKRLLTACLVVWLAGAVIVTRHMRPAQRGWFGWRKEG